MIGEFWSRLCRLLTPAPPAKAFDVSIFDGLEVPQHLVGKPFEIRDAEGKVVARVRVRD